MIGLIPWIGDLFGLFFAMQLVHTAEKIEGGLPVAIRLKMISNVIFDFVMGLIPLVGDFVNILYKCNSRNFILLEKYLVEKHSSLNSNMAHMNKNELQALEDDGRGPRKHEILV